MTSYQHIKLWTNIYITKLLPIMDAIILAPLAVLIFILMVGVACVWMFAYYTMLIADFFLGCLALALRVIMAEEI